MRVELIKSARRARRKKRIRKKLSGTPRMPRLAVYRSHRNIGAQIIDDLRGQFSYAGNAKAAVALGKTLGEKAKSLGIEQVCFDRGGCAYHGRVKALADAAREAGLRF